MGAFEDRLNQIIPRITSKELLANEGLGNEIGFYIFDYPPEKELQVREHIQFTLNYLAKKKPNIRVKHINLFELIINYLKSRKLFDRALKIEKEKGPDELLKALRAPLGADKIAKVFTEEANPSDYDLVMVSGEFDLIVEVMQVEDERVHTMFLQQTNRALQQGDSPQFDQGFGFVIGQGL